MTQEDIIRMAREAKLYEDGKFFVLEHGELTHFAALVAAAQREKVAAWMRSMGYATGHGGTTEDLLDHLGTQIAEKMKAEREACAKMCEDSINLEPYPTLTKMAAAIRARGNK